MPTFQLLNLYVGDRRPAGEFSDRQIGPAHVKLIDDYQNAVGKLTKSGQLKVNWTTDDQGQFKKTLTSVPGVQGEWVVTATVDLPHDPERPSILGRVPINDGGLFDLCELLTFATGRRVTIGEFTDRHNPRTKGESFCPPFGALPVVAHAWQARQNLVENKCQYALLTHNKAFDTWALQEMGSHYNTALNVLLDQWPYQVPTVSKAIRKELRDRVAEAVDLIHDLSPEHRVAYKAILGARAMQGPSSLIDQLINLLVDLGIIGNPPSADQRMRAQFVNAVRNTLTHSGQIPELKGLTQEQADRYCFTIVGGVVPAINRQAIGRLLGFSPSQAPWLQEDLDSLRQFFLEGIWRTWPLESAEFHDWISQLQLTDIFPVVLPAD